MRALIALASLAAFASGCRVCGGWSHPDDFVLSGASSPSTAGKVLFEIHATSSFDGATALSDESVVLKAPGDTSGAAAPSPSPWKLELVTDANGDGMIEAGDVIQVVQLPDIAGGVDLTSGRSYDVALFTRVSQDGVSAPVMSWQSASAWTVP